MRCQRKTLEILLSVRVDITKKARNKILEGAPCNIFGYVHVGFRERAKVIDSTEPALKLTVKAYDKSNDVSIKA